MRHLLTVIIVSVVILITIFSLSGKGAQESASADEKRSEVQNDSAQSLPYWDKPLVESNDIKVYAEYGLPKNDWKLGDDMYYKDDSYLIRYENNGVADSMILVGPHNGIYGEGYFCKVVVGIDTVNIDIRNPFPRTHDLRFKDAIPGCKLFRLSRHYALNEKAWPTDFQINIALKESTPLYIMNFISTMIRDNVAGYFTDYTNDNPQTPNIPIFKISGNSVDEMMQYYYTLFCTQYNKEFLMDTDPDGVVMGDRYSYQFYACPIWENPDSILTTWRFYTYSYMGGAHGGEMEFFLTFENKSGRILGVSDFYSTESFKDAIANLTLQLNEYVEKLHNGEHDLDADLDCESGVTAIQSKILNEKIDGKIYPRPAITKNGIVFSYQKYEKGSNADGTLHFIVPFNGDTIKDNK